MTQAGKWGCSPPRAALLPHGQCTLRPKTLVPGLPGSAIQRGASNPPLCVDDGPVHRKKLGVGKRRESIDRGDVNLISFKKVQAGKIHEKNHLFGAFGQESF